MSTKSGLKTFVNLLCLEICFCLDGRTWTLSRPQKSIGSYSWPNKASTDVANVTACRVVVMCGRVGILFRRSK